jgi:hypothetical protein
MIDWTARHWTLSGASWIQSTPTPSHQFPKFHFNSIFPSCFVTKTLNVVSRFDLHACPGFIHITISEKNTTDLVCSQTAFRQSGHSASSGQSNYRTIHCIFIAFLNTTLSYNGWKYRSSLIGTEIGPPPPVQNIVVKMSEGGVPYQYTLHSVWDWPRIAINKYQPHAMPYSYMVVGEGGGEVFPSPTTQWN